MQNSNYCHVKLSGKLDEIPKRRHRKKSMKIQFVIYTDAESLLDQILAAIIIKNDTTINEFYDKNSLVCNLLFLNIHTLFFSYHM